MNRRTLLALVGSLTGGIAVGAYLSDSYGTEPPVDAGCPSFADGADSLCAHTADDLSLALRPSSWRLDSGSNVALTFELTNESDATVRFASVPVLKRRTDDEWKHVWPMVTPKLTNRLEPGASFSWEFAFYAERTTTAADERVAMFALDPGTYAAVLTAEFGDRTVQCVAPFEVGESESKTEKR